jgi:hypothetical protein
MLTTPKLVAFVLGANKGMPYILVNLSADPLTNTKSASSNKRLNAHSQETIV